MGNVFMANEGSPERLCEAAQHLTGVMGEGHDSLQIILKVLWPLDSLTRALRTKNAHKQEWRENAD